MEVDLRVTKETTFPAGLAVGTRVEFEGTQRFTQDLLTFEGSQRFAFEPVSGEYMTFPMFGDIDPDIQEGTIEAGEFSEASDLQVARVVDETLTVNAEFDVTLVPEQYDSAARPYDWVVRQIGLDTKGRMLALIEVRLTEPQNNSRTVFQKRHNKFTGEIELFGPVQLIVRFPVQTLLFAVIDVGTADPAARVVASTGTPLFQPVISNTADFTVLQKKVTGPAEGGPRSGEILTLWETVGGALHPEAWKNPAPLVVTNSVSTVSGVQDFALPGWYRPEIQLAVETPTAIQTTTPTATLIYAVIRRSRAEKIYKAYEHHFNTSNLDGYVTSLRHAQRMRPGSGAEHLLVFGRLVGVREGEEGVLLAWNGEDRQAHLALEEELPPAGQHKAVSVTPKRAMVVSGEFGFGTTRLIDLDTRQTITAFGEDLSERFLWLDPTFFYSVQDLKFYRPQPFRKTALPAKLADVLGSPAGDFHLIQKP
jgi:hypothetical protein